METTDYLVHKCTSTGTTPCWIWRWATDRRGYAQASDNKTALKVGRALLGILGTDDIQMHICDNPPCVNPSHLRVGTHADNAADRDSKKRTAARARNGGAKLTESDVVRIRSLIAAGETYASVASLYPVSVCQIGRIGRGECWPEG